MKRRDFLNVVGAVPFLSWVPKRSPKKWFEICLDQPGYPGLAWEGKDVLKVDCEFIGTHRFHRLVGKNLSGIAYQIRSNTFGKDIQFTALGQEHVKSLIHRFPAINCIHPDLKLMDHISRFRIFCNDFPNGIRCYTKSYIYTFSSGSQGLYLNFIESND